MARNISNRLTKDALQCTKGQPAKQQRGIKDRVVDRGRTSITRKERRFYSGSVRPAERLPSAQEAGRQMVEDDWCVQVIKTSRRDKSYRSDDNTPPDQQQMPGDRAWREVWIAGKWMCRARSWAESDVQTRSKRVMAPDPSPQCCRAKPKGSIWFFYKWTDTAFGFAEQSVADEVWFRSECLTHAPSCDRTGRSEWPW